MHLAAKTDLSLPVPVAFVIDQLRIGGTEQQLATLLQGLDQHLFKPILVTIHGNEMCFDVPCEKYFFRTKKLLSPTACATVFRLASLFKQKQIRIVQAFFFDSAVLAVPAARIARTPRVILSRRDMGFWQTPARLAVMKMLDRLSHRVLVNSESVRRQIMQNENVPAEKVDVIHNGIVVAPFNSDLSAAEAKQKLGIAANSPVVGIVSNLNREVKRLDVFLEAAGMLTKSFPNTRFVIAGEGHLREKLEEKSRALGLNGSVKFLGSVKSISPLLRAFDIGVNCSDSEGLSNAVVEYMLAGIPVAVSSVAGNQEVIQDGVEGFHFPPSEAASLAARISVLLENPKKAREMGSAGREQALRKFSAETMVQRHMEYYQKLLCGQA